MDPRHPSQQDEEDNLAAISAAVAKRLKSDHRTSIDSTGETHHQEDPRRTIARSAAPSEGERSAFNFKIRVADYRMVEDIAHTDRVVAYDRQGRSRVVRRKLYEVMDEALELLRISRELKAYADSLGLTPAQVIQGLVESCVSGGGAKEVPKRARKVVTGEEGDRAKPASRGERAKNTDATTRSGQGTR